MLRTAFHRLEEGAVSALTKLEAVLTPRRNLSERHVYNQFSRRAAEYDETRLVGKLSSRQESQAISPELQLTLFFFFFFFFWVGETFITNMQ